MGTKTNIRLEIRRHVEIKLSIALYNNTLVPFVLILTFSLATLAAMIHSQRGIKSLGLDHSRSKKRRQRDIKFGMTMIVVNLLFLLLMAVNQLKYFTILNPFNPKKQLIPFRIFNMCILQLSDCYFMTNFYVQLAVNKMVRRECKRLLRQLVCLHNTRSVQPVGVFSFSRDRSFNQTTL